MLGIQKNLAIMEAIAKKYDVPYLSPSTVTFKDEWFVDGCHLNEEGERVKADWILAGVTRELGSTGVPRAGHGAPARNVSADDRQASVRSR
jgi:hypothetical protein